MKATSRKPKNKKQAKEKKKTKKLIVRLLKVLMVMFLTGVFIMALALAYFWVSTESVSDSNFWKSKIVTNIYDRNNKLIASDNAFEGNSEYVELDEISDYYIKGLIDTEDERFYKHSGVDLFGMIRATFQTLLTSSDSGGSTLTMQLAKNLYLAPTPQVDKDGNFVYDEEGKPVLDYPRSRPISYKLKQMVFAWKIEANYSKDEIIENYVNYLDFTHMQVGIEAASKYYYGTDSKDLTLSEAASLAGLTQAPSKYDPYLDVEKTMGRTSIVLDRMEAVGDITKEEAEQAKKYNLEDSLVDHTKSSSDQNYYIYQPVIEIVSQELVSEFGNDFDMENANANIYTTIDSTIQKDMFEDVNNLNGDIAYPGDLIQAGVATLDSQTGGVLALSGGRLENGNLPNQNYGAFYKRQPGSTSKPIVDYGPAIEFLDWATYHQTIDRKTNYTGGPAVENAYDGYKGKMSIQEGLARSSNTVALQTFQAIASQKGTGVISKFLTGLGITDIDENFNEAYSIGGWQYGTTPLELAGAYAAFANGGTFNQPHIVEKVEFNKDSPYYNDYSETEGKHKFEYDSYQAMEESTAYMVSKMLDPNLPYALTNSPRLKGVGDQAIKTGTSNWAENDYGIPEGAPRDKWVAGYTPDVTTVVWSGYDGSVEAEGIYFDSYGLWSYDLYQSIMSDITANTDTYLHDDYKFVLPTDVYIKKYKGIPYYFKKGTFELKNAPKNVVEKKESSSKESSSKKVTSSSSKKSSSKKVTSSSSKESSSSSKESSSIAPVESSSEESSSVSA